MRACVRACVRAVRAHCNVSVSASVCCLERGGDVCKTGALVRGEITESWREGISCVCVRSQTTRGVFMSVFVCAFVLDSVKKKEMERGRGREVMRERESDSWASVTVHAPGLESCAAK